MKLLLLLIIVLATVSPAASTGPPSGVSSDEWASIQAQIEAERHKIVESERPDRLYRADNPTQRFTAHFGAEDMVIEPVGSGEPAWHLGLRLTTWGAAHDLKQVEFAHATAEGDRVEYRRGPLTEWYVNTSMGLEQGFTIEAPPGDDIDELVLEMALESDLTPALAEGGQAVAFQREGGNALVSYSGLKTWDAVGEPLEAWMELVRGCTRIRLIVEVSEAAWPITVDPVFALVARLLPTPDLDNHDALFGLQVAIDGTRMVAWINDRMTGDFSGALDVFERGEETPAGWNHVGRISTTDHAAAESFGFSIGISDDTIVVGAPYDDVAGEDSGSVFIFRPEEGETREWTQVAKLIALDGGSNDNFGISVAIDGDIVAVGTQINVGGSAYIYDRNQGGADAWGLVTTLSKPNGSFGNAVSVCGDTLIAGSFRDDAVGSESGSAYVFDRNHGGVNAWGQVAKVVASDGSANEWFGYSVSIDGDAALVGTPFDEDTSPNSGSAYVYGRDVGGSNSWGQVAKVTPSDGEVGDYFGYQVSISGDTAAVGAWGDDDSGQESGAAYLFQRDEGGLDGWGQLAKLKGTSGTAWDNFGASVAISANIVAVGVPGDDGDFFNSGSVELFEENVGVWGPMALIPCPPVLVAEGESFANAVSMDGNTAIVGAYHDDDHGENSGSAYVFRRDEGGTESWGLVAKIVPADGQADDRFGTSVAVSGDMAVVGADRSMYVFDRDIGGIDGWGQAAKISSTSGRFGSAISISGDTAIVGSYGNNSHGSYAGAAYIHQRDQGGPGAWGQVAELFASDATDYSLFGYSVAISGDTVVIGSPQDPLHGTQPCSAYIFERDEGGPQAWGQVAKIIPTTGSYEDHFGNSVSIDGDTVVVGSDFDDVFLYGSGSAYVFQRDQGGPGSWGQVAKITPTDGAGGDRFGFSVSVSGNAAVIGTPQDDDGGDNSGSSYVFVRDHGGTDAWGQVAKITVGESASGDRFGSAVSISGSYVIAGSPDSTVLGLGSGSAYVHVIGDRVFVNGFETGDTSEWSATVP